MKFILYILFSFCWIHLSSQYYTNTQKATIHANGTAVEGDLYIDTINNSFHIGLTSGKLAELNDNTTEITQTAHGFVLPPQGVLPLYYNKITGRYALALADSLNHAMDVLAIGFPDANTIRIKQSGYLTINHGLNVGSWYFLDLLNVGGIIEENLFSCLLATNVKQPLFFTISPNKLLLVNERAKRCADFSDFVNKTTVLDESFETPGLYTTTGDASINNDATCANSGTSYLEIGENNGILTSSVFNLSGCDSIEFSFAYKEVTGAGCGENNQPEAGEGFVLQYFNGAAWVTVFFSDGGDDIFTYTTVTTVINGPLPVNFQYRFGIYNGNNNADYWNIDDVLISCYD